MLALKEAGLPICGAKFPKETSQFTKAGNPKGYWECTEITSETGLQMRHKKVGKDKDIIKIIADKLYESDPRLIGKTVVIFRKPKQILASILKANIINRMRDFICLYAFDIIDTLGYLTYHKKKFIAVFYEDILKDPEKELKKICKFLGKGDYKKGAKAIEPKLNRSKEYAKEIKFVSFLEKIYNLAKESKFKEIIDLEEEAKKISNQIEDNIIGCQQCGYCCERIWLAIGREVTDDIKRWIEMHDIKLLYKSGTILAEIENRCKHLTKDNKCSIYNDRPNVCRSYLCKKALGYK
jgi:hypothetical protein